MGFDVGGLRSGLRFVEFEVPWNAWVVSNVCRVLGLQLFIL